MTTPLHSRLHESVLRHPDAIAVTAPGCHPVSYAELERRVAAFAAALEARGARGGRVGLLLPNVTAFPVALFAVLRAGASAVLLNPLYSRREIAEYLADSGARLTVTMEALEHLLPLGARKLVLEPSDGCVDPELEDDDLPAATPAQAEEGEWSADDEAVVIYTSATGGWAKGARLTHRSLGANLDSTVEAMLLAPEDRVLALLPFVHAFGLTVTLTAPLVAGATVVPFERFQPVRALDALEETGATVVCGVPAMYLALVAAAERRGVPRHRLRVAICGGAPLSPEVARRWEDTFGLPLREGYGLTEASPVCLFNRVDHPNRPGTLGHPFPGVEVTLRDSRGRVVPQGETGEICVLGANVFAGYVGEEGRPSERCWDGALRTGDLGCVEADGAVRFRGFLKRMFTRGGYNIYPREIERVLEEDPRVAEASVRPVPDAARENEIALTVVPTPGAELDEAAVREICRECLAAYKQPGQITVEQ